MKKVININFQGRVIPIEESAYDILKQYIESLRRYFANEESREEIINDIESRIGELFAERLKKGATCITDEDVNAVIASMGRPEELEAEDAEINGINSKQEKRQSGGSQSQAGATGGAHYNYATRGRLYRNADDKIIAGVCSGLANYLGIDPVVMRIIFVLLIAPLFWVYILLWLIIPSTSIKSNITKRLYRSADDKVIGGVCGGLGAYFNISTWVPRLIFALPLILAIISGPFNWWWHDMDFFWAPKIITGGFGTTLFFTYVVLWIAVPVAVTAAEKLEMRGEKVDLNSIRNTVKEDLEGFKQKAQNFGSEVKETAQQFGEKAKDFGRSASTSAKTFTYEAGAAGGRAGSGIGHVIGVIFKAFFIFVGGIIALVLFAVFIGLLFTGFAFFPLKDFVFDSTWNNFLAWVGLFLFLGIPLLGLITWLIRRIMGVRSRNHYLGFIFGGLWTIGLISVILLSASVQKSFRSSGSFEQVVNLQPLRSDKLIVDVSNQRYDYYGPDWFGAQWDDAFFTPISDDTVILNTVKIEVWKSTDSEFHVATEKQSLGRDQRSARESAQNIDFPVTQQDSLLVLPRGFAITREQKWRAQQVLVRIQVPVGKRIYVDRSIYGFEDFDINYNGRRWNRFDRDENWDRRYWVEPGVEYIMTPEGPKRVKDLDPEELAKGNYIQLEEQERNRRKPGNNDGYRYRKDSLNNKKDSLKKTDNSSGSNTEADGEDETLGSNSSGSTDAATPMTSLLRMFQ